MVPHRWDVMNPTVTATAQAAGRYSAMDGGVVAARRLESVTMVPAVQMETVAVVRVADVVGCEVAWQDVWVALAAAWVANVGKAVYCPEPSSVECWDLWPPIQTALARSDGLTSTLGP